MKMHHFCQFSMAAGGQHGDFQTFLDFEKTPALGDLLRADVSKYRPEVYKSEKSKILKKIHKVALSKLLTQM